MWGCDNAQKTGPCRSRWSAILGSGWTELDIACRPWQPQSLQQAMEGKVAEQDGVYSYFELRADELGMTGLVLGKIAGVTTSLCQTAPNNTLVTPWPRVRSRLHQWRLQNDFKETLLFGSDSASTFPDLSDLWSPRGQTLLREQYPDVLKWLDENASFSIGCQELRGGFEPKYDPSEPHFANIHWTLRPSFRAFSLVDDALDAYDA